MRVLVTGADGFVGRHAVSELEKHGHHVHAVDRSIPGNPDKRTDWHTCDIRDTKTLVGLVQSILPEACLHLAGFSHVPTGWTAPQHMYEVNVMGTLNLLDAFLQLDAQVRLLVVSTAQIYGTGACPAAITEEHAFNPCSLYAVSKAAADMTTLLYARHHGMHAMTVRPNNHIGPGQADSFVVPSFAAQVSAIAAGAKPIIRVGNLESKRDFTDVRDVARAYRLLLEKGKSGCAYNLGSDQLVSIRTVLEGFCHKAGIHPDIVEDKTLYRPTDNSPLLDTRRIRSHTGWAPEIDLATTLSDILAQHTASVGSLPRP